MTVLPLTTSFCQVSQQIKIKQGFCYKFCFFNVVPKYI